ncbi:uracil-DNA glycosylase [Rheinheimera sp. F8]|uniref:uracil-DNA glycosylase n=1 Tax=Rheinheimera sp. F8 TaxID=1763998 RepID=UPI000744B2F5|nr:uracil-DNA glycosylase [Rheinheimera sp. F8]ALZ77343.1 uracil-DNA glycosylase [Rheinheimera sp. F8]
MLHPLVEQVASLQFDNCFNPYSDRCQVYDKYDAPRIRALMLSAMLNKAIEEPVDAIWVGRDLGYRGGRRTGLALTDEVNIIQHAKRWNIELPNERPTLGDAVAERTAAILWGMLNRIDSRIFLWNVFPLHPHESGQPFSNRQHNSQERRAGEEILRELIILLRPNRIVAIGNDAATAVQRLTRNQQVISVRHPSYGGQTKFETQISELYKIVSR